MAIPVHVYVEMLSLTHANNLTALCFLAAESCRQPWWELFKDGKISLLGHSRNRVFFESTVPVNSTLRISRHFSSFKVYSVHSKFASKVAQN